MKNFKEFIVSEDYPTSGDYMQPMQADWNVGDIDYIKPNTSKPLRVKKPPKAPNDPGTIPNKAYLDTSKTDVTEAAKCKDCGQNPCICDDSHGFVKEGADDHYAEAEEHLNKASKALETSDMAAHHFHMSNHHEAKSQWHEAKGRYLAADSHAAKAEKHHEKSLKAAGIKEEVMDVASTYKKLSVKHLKDMSKATTEAQKNYAKKMIQRSIEASKMDNHTDALNHYRGVSEETINELSSDTLQSYKEKAKKSADELTAKGEHGKALGRTMSRMKATGKQMTKTTASIKKALNKEEVELDEATTGATKLVHTRTGKDGAKYHIMQDSPSDFSIHREHNGKTKHIDTYGSLHRAKSVLDNEVVSEAAQAKHRVAVTVSEKDHPMVSKRLEKQQKRVIVSADSENEAVTRAKKFYSKQGYHVHDAEYHSPITEGKKSPGIGWMIKKDPTIKAIIDKHKQKMKDFKAHVGTRIEPKDKK